jgi:perosamine synthetase
MLRHLPPTAAPITPSDVRLGLSPSPAARAQFETALTQYLDVHTCKLAASGRTALYLLLQGLRQAADHPDRREVVMPAYTCPALAKVAIDAGLRPRFVDITPHTMAFREDHLEASIGGHTLAVICVHPFGIPQPIEHIQPLAHEAGAVVIEDAAQAMGARLDGKPVGTLGDYGLYSLGPGKPLSTGGGGVLCTKDGRHAPLLERAWEGLPLPSVISSAWALVRFVLCNLVFHPLGWWLGTRAGLQRLGEHEASWGYSVLGLNDSQAAVGLALLARLETVNRQRRDNARRLIDRLGKMEFVHIPAPAQTAEATYLRLPLIVDDEERRERLFRRLWDAGIGVGRMYRHPLPHYVPHQVDDEVYPGADYVARHLLTLPTHHYLTHADVEGIVEIFQAERSGK